MLGVHVGFAWTHRGPLLWYYECSTEIYGSDAASRLTRLSVLLVGEGFGIVVVVVDDADSEALGWLNGDRENHQRTIFQHHWPAFPRCAPRHLPRHHLHHHPRDGCNWAGYPHHLWKTNEKKVYVLKIRLEYIQFIKHEACRLVFGSHHRCLCILQMLRCLNSIFLLLCVSFLAFKVRLDM